MDLVFLHGPAASGKLTTARAVEALVGYPVFHNHIVVDMLTALFPFGSPSFVQLREEFWLGVFVEAARADRSLIFTFSPEATVKPGFAARVTRAVEEAGGRVRFVRLVVSEAEQERRIDAPSRHEFQKLTSLTTLRGLRARARGEEPPAELVIETDNSTPAESAARIVDVLRLETQPAQARY